MRVAYLISNVTRARTPTNKHARTHTHTEENINTYCFSTAKWFREHASMLRCTYIACLVITYQYTELSFFLRLVA